MITSIFDSELGKELYKRACQTIEKYSMREAISSGVLVGFSGGADSVFLLNFLIEYKKREKLSFPILAVHINHSIRGDEANRDEEESRAYANALGVEFISYKHDVPTYANDMSIGLEEAARILRYGTFDTIIQGRNDISTILVAHNSNDNLETVIFNILRGSGSKGASGILPMRENICRPLIEISKAEILSLLQEKNIPYVTDSTNFSLEYSRNYIRAEIAPRLERITEAPERAVLKLSENLRCDNSFIEEYARSFLSEHCEKGKISAESLSSLHEAPFARAISFLAKEFDISLEKVHIDSIRELLPKGNFKISLPNGYEFVSEFGACRIMPHVEKEEFLFELKLGENRFEEFSDAIIVSDKKIDNSFKNVHKISIQAALDFDIMSDRLFVRNKRDGDFYRFGGMTRKVKKLFSDKKIPESERKNVPVFASDKEIFWVAGFKERDKMSDSRIYVAICEMKDENNSSKRKFYVK